jgi:hypothetical protein
VQLYRRCSYVEAKKKELHVTEYHPTVPYSANALRQVSIAKIVFPGKSSFGADDYSL